MGFLVVALLILVVSYISIMTQEKLIKDSQELAEEILPGAITEAMIQTKLHQAVNLVEKYVSGGNVSDRERTEEAIVALEEYMAAHRLYHSSHHLPAYIDMIDETIETFTSFTMEYILAKDRGASKEELYVVKAKIDQVVNVFVSQIEPTLREHVESGREVVNAAKQNIKNSRKFILGSSAVIFSIAIALGFFISRLISRPIKNLSEAAGRIGKGQLDIQIEPASKDEIGQLAISFNKMIKDLQTITVSRDAFAQEVAEHKKAADALQKSEEKLAGIVNSVTDAMIMVDEEYNVAWNNKIAVEMFGANMVGKKCYKAYHGRDEVCKQCIVKTCFKDGNVHEFETEIAGAAGDRMSLWGKASVASWDEDGRPKMAVEFLRDITERKEAQKEIETLKQQMEFILGATNTGIDIIDSEFNIRYIDPEWQKVYGDPAGIKCYEYFMDRNEVCPGCGIVKALETKSLAVTEEVLVREDNRPIQVTTIPFQNEEGEWLVAEVNVDITERKQVEKALQAAYDQSIIYAEQLKKQIEEKEKLETQLLQAQKMEAVGTLAGGIAHDFNNILQAISGYVQLLLIKKEVKDSGRLYLNQIDKSTRKAAELTKQLLIFSRKAESKLRAVDLNQEIKGVHKLFQRTIPKMIDIELHLAENLKLINADPVQLEQIMMNLGVNARDAMPDGGKLTFETRNVVLEEEYYKTHVDVIPGEYVLFRISDTGHGMDRKTLERIFEPFYTTKETGKGTGLGLSIVYGLVESHGGHIMCYSEPEQGTIFKIYFPALLIENIEQEIEPEEEVMIRGGHETILIVDDEEALRDQGRDMLIKYGYTAITAENGEMAIEIYKKEKDRINLVILDIGMPGMGGYKCLEQLFKIDPEIKVIIASGYASSSMVDETLEAGAADFISKPYRITDMLKRVRDVLDQE